MWVPEWRLLGLAISTIILELPCSGMVIVISMHFWNRFSGLTGFLGSELVSRLCL